MITIKKAAELTGVPEHTLRAWERRYGLVTPGRTPGGYRLYDEQSLDRFRLMHDLVQTGWAPRQAAAEALRRGQQADASLRGEQELVAAAAAVDGDAAEKVLDAQFARGSFETVVDEWLMPVLTVLGRAWASGEVSVAGEHLVSNLVMRRLAAAYEAAGQPASGRTLIVGAPPGVDHEIGLLAFATAARRAGLITIYLGSQLPAEAWRGAAASTGASAAVSSLHRRRDAVRLHPVVDALADRPDLELWVGGAHQRLAPPPFRPLGHSIGGAATRLATADAGPA